MAPEKFIKVDDLLPRITVPQVIAYYGAELPELKKVGQETRFKCILACGKAEETGPRAIAIQDQNPVKPWKCHQYGCDKGGNLVSFCDLLKPGPNMAGKPRGDRFKDIAKDLQAMANGQPVAGNTQAEDHGRKQGVSQPKIEDPLPPAIVRPVNVPLAESDNERARALTELDRKFVTDVGAMSPKASLYFRRRPYLTPEVCQQFRIGYLPQSTGDDKTGGTMRGKIVYPYFSADGKLLTWFGRDPEFEEKRKAWEASAKTEPEPDKFRFVKGFHRGLELWGQHLVQAPEHAEALKSLGLLLVEGPNDVIRLATLGVPAVALCSNTITRDQAARVALLAKEVAGGHVTIFLDCDPEGETGMKQCLGYLAHLTYVRLAWTSQMFGGKFKGRQPELLSGEEWGEIQRGLNT